jgi:hypothetical protein
VVLLTMLVILGFQLATHGGNTPKPSHAAVVAWKR